VWVCGPTGVGKSTAAFAFYRQLLARGMTAAYADARQLGFLPGAGHRLRARNLADLWWSFRGSGATHIVISGPLRTRDDVNVYRQAFGGDTVVVCRLHAEPSILAQRITSRAAGHGWAEPGNPIREQPPDRLATITARAFDEADALDRAGFGYPIDSGALGPSLVALAIEDVLRRARETAQ
jgi:hypothetical protein